MDIRPVHIEATLPWAMQMRPKTIPGPCSQPDCGKKADKHCEPNYKLRSRHSLKRCKHRIIKAETLHVSAERADRNPPVVEKWYV